MAATLSALGIFDGKSPEYASAVFIELHKTDQNGEFIVKVFRKNVTDEDTVHAVEMPGKCYST